MSDTAINALRPDPLLWTSMREASVSFFHETRAINEAPDLSELATEANRVDLNIGENNSASAPYSETFTHIAKPIPRA